MNQIDLRIDIVEGQASVQQGPHVTTTLSLIRTKRTLPKKLQNAQHVVIDIIYIVMFNIVIILLLLCD